MLQRFKSAEHAQHFLGPFSAVSNQFRPRRHLLTASSYRQIRTERYAGWRDVTLAGVRPLKPSWLLDLVLERCLRCAYEVIQPSD